MKNELTQEIKKTFLILQYSTLKSTVVEYNSWHTGAGIEPANTHSHLWKFATWRFVCGDLLYREVYRRDEENLKFHHPEIKIIICVYLPKMICTYICKGIYYFYVIGIVLFIYFLFLYSLIVNRIFPFH